MHQLNRVNLIGTIASGPQIYSIGRNERLMTLEIVTEILNAEHETQPIQLHRHKIAINESLIIEYADSFLSVGDLVFVEGQLEQLATGSETWIVVSQSYGLIHLLSRSTKASGGQSSNESTNIQQPSL